MVSKDRGKRIIPDDWQQSDGYYLFMACVPKSSKWVGVINGALATLQYGRYWDSTTGNVKETQAIVEEIRDSVIMTCMNELADAIRYVGDRIQSSSVSSGCGCGCGPAGTGTQVDEPEGSEPTVFGPSEEWPDYATYKDDKCHAANAMYDALLEVIDQLRAYDADTLLAGGVTISTGLVATILVGFVATAPIAIVVGVVSGIIALVAGPLAFSLTDLYASLVTHKADIICAWYSAVDENAAEANYIAVVDDGSLSVFETSFLSLISTTAFFNQLFAPSAELLAVNVPSPYDCTLCAPCELFYAVTGIITAQTGHDVTVQAQDNGIGDGRIELWANTDGSAAPNRTACDDEIEFQSIVLSSGHAGVNFYDSSQSLIGSYHTDPANTNLPPAGICYRHVDVSWNTGTGIGATATIVNTDTC